MEKGLEPTLDDGRATAAGVASLGRATRLAVDGVDLEVFEGGEGPPLVALHGLLELPRWQAYHELLAQRFHVIAPSHPGFGGSSRPAWMESVDDLAYFYLDVLEQLDLGPVHLVGHSFGAWIAAEAAVRCSHLLSKLVLVDAVGLRPVQDPFGPPGGYIADWLVLEPEDLRARAWHSPDSGHRLKLPGEEGTTDAELTELIHNREAATVYGWRPFFYSPRLQPWLHRVRVPTLVVWGEHDGVVPRAVGETYANSIPGARFLIQPDTAHLPHLERPDAFVQIVGDFLAQSPR